jgi:predicted aminopeptidase
MAAKQRQRQFIALVADCRRQLQAVYDSGVALPAMRLQKAEVFENFYDDYEKLKDSWDGYTGYDAWLRQTPLNNAKLVSVAVYQDYVPAFFKLLRGVDNDLPQFYAQCRDLAAMPKEMRDQRMLALLKDPPDPN